jgi:hypothetical protein
MGNCWAIDFLVGRKKPLDFRMSDARVGKVGNEQQTTAKASPTGFDAGHVDGRVDHPIQFAGFFF